ncbi:MAG TPA: GSCFA domain-containing protein [Stellaceae bacterium]|nr:GSCFA domain-containing protein [Stellaceae bacterium]
MSLNPYSGRLAHTFWGAGVVDRLEQGVDPVVDVPFTLSRTDAIGTAGSCFAQHISRTLVQRGFNYLITEKFQGEFGTTDENYGMFPARFGNIYSPRQLLQLFERAYGLRQPRADWWRGKIGGFIDPFRPRIQTTGFPSVEALHADRERHLAAVRQMFEQCQAFVFTLGLTETWMSSVDGSVYPLAPGVVATEMPGADAKFHNFGVNETVSDMIEFLDRLAMVNPQVKVILTVSPVPLIATYEDRHVLVSTIASKSILRAAVEEVIRQRPDISYFPAYEIVTGPQARGRFYGQDLREVTTAGVSYVMSLFFRHYLATDIDNSTNTPDASAQDVRLSMEDQQRFSDLAAIICDEEAIAQ